MSSHVILVTNDNMLRNLLEQIFIIRGDTTLTVCTLQDAEAILEQWDSVGCRLTLIDTAALSRCEPEQRRVACRLVEDWSTMYPMLPFLFLGTLLQKYALLEIRTDIIQFIVTPFHWNDLIVAIEGLCPLQDSPQPSPTL